MFVINKILKDHLLHSS